MNTQSMTIKLVSWVAVICLLVTVYPVNVLALAPKSPFEKKRPDALYHNGKTYYLEALESSTFHILAAELERVKKAEKKEIELRPGKVCGEAA